MSVETASTAPTTMSVESGEISDKYQQNEKLVNEEFKIWKKTSPLLYDLIYSYANESPALSLAWVPSYGHHEYNGVGYVNAKFLMGTQSKSANSIKLMSLDLPKTLASEYENRDLSYASAPLGHQISREIKIEREWTHPGEVNKLKFNEGLNLIATQSNTGDVLVYDVSDTSLNTQKTTLKYHTKEGLGLEWNPLVPTQLLSSAEDASIALWDFGEKVPSKPTRTFGVHERSVNDIAWNRQCPSLFVSVSDDSSYQLHDLRTTEGPIVHVTNGHHSEAGVDYPITAVDFCEGVSTLFATGGADGMVQLWDLRNPTIPVRKLQYHTGGVLGVQFKENYLMSNALDRRVVVWDLNKLEEGEVDRRKSDHVDPCVAFVHGGHTGKVLSCDWHPRLSQLFVSCADDDLIEVWKPAHMGAEYNEDEEEEDKNEEKDEEDESKDQVKKEAPNGITQSPPAKTTEDAA